MDGLQVERWISWEDAKNYEGNVLGGFGGFFDHGMRWKDYIKDNNNKFISYAEALRKEVLVKNIRFGGDDHQNKSDGTPLFTDGTAATFSYRAWGDFLAAVWSEAENKDYCYMAFYMTGW
jgi:hypothetical protein